VFYEEAVKVPLILSWPGVIPAGQRCPRVVSALDLNATILDALGAPPLVNSPGRSFLGLVSPQRALPDWEDVAFSEYCADEYVPPVIDGGRGLEPQLFNLAADPGELVDRAQDPACLTIRNELTGRILTDWNPELIAAKMTALRADNRVLRAWAQQTHPPDQYRWELRTNQLPKLAARDSPEQQAGRSGSHNRCGAARDPLWLCR
jgi:choline-sulfatase